MELSVGVIDKQKADNPSTWNRKDDTRKANMRDFRVVHTLQRQKRHKCRNLASNIPTIERHDSHAGMPSIVRNEQPPGMDIYSGVRYIVMSTTLHVSDRCSTSLMSSWQGVETRSGRLVALVPDTCRVP
jgi:hypothetical protein